MNTFGKVCKVSSFVILIGCFIAGIVAGRDTYYNEYAGTIDDIFRWNIFWGILFDGFVSFLLVYGFGEIIQYLSYINRNAIYTKNTLCKIKELFISEIKEREKDVTDSLVLSLIEKDESTLNDIWVCDNCKSKNTNRAVNEFGNINCDYCGALNKIKWQKDIRNDEQ